MNRLHSFLLLIVFLAPAYLSAQNRWDPGYAANKGKAGGQATYQDIIGQTTGKRGNTQAQARARAGGQQGYTGRSGNIDEIGNDAYRCPDGSLPILGQCGDSTNPYPYGSDEIKNSDRRR